MGERLGKADAVRLRDLAALGEELRRVQTEEDQQRQGLFLRSQPDEGGVERDADRLAELLGEKVEEEEEEEYDAIIMEEVDEFGRTVEDSDSTLDNFSDDDVEDGLED